MNILTGPLPTKIKIGDSLYDINYDYRTIIKILIAFEDNNLTEYEKITIMLKNLYKEEIPDNLLEEAITKAIKFIDLGEDYTNKPKENKNRIYSFTKDANYIFSGINSTHGIDLEKMSDMHWWKFMSFFMDMNNECTFATLVYYRKRKLEGKLTKEEKEEYRKIKDIVELDMKETFVEDKQRQEFFKEFYKK